MIRHPEPLPTVAALTRAALQRFHDVHGLRKKALKGMTSLNATSNHEAGHAVHAVAVGVGCARVEIGRRIGPDGPGWLGWTTWGEGWGELYDKDPVDARHLTGVIATAALKLAGVAGEALGGQRYPLTSLEEQAAAFIGSRVLADALGRTAHEIYHAIAAETYATLEDNRGAWLRLACRLRAERRLQRPAIAIEPIGADEFTRRVLARVGRGDLHALPPAFFTDWPTSAREVAWARNPSR